VLRPYVNYGRRTIAGQQFVNQVVLLLLLLLLVVVVVVVVVIVVVVTTAVVEILTFTSPVHASPSLSTLEMRS